jgi:hypothetical protein
LTIVEEERRESLNRQNDFRKLLEKLESGEIIYDTIKKKRAVKKDAFQKLSSKVIKFKEVHMGRESELDRIL